MSEGRSRSAQLRSIAWFLALFAIYYLAGSLALATPWGERFVVEPWIRANVATALTGTATFGLPARAQGRTILTDRPVLDVNRGCDGLEAVLIVVSAVAAFPASWSARWPGILVGCVGVFAVNAARIATLLWAAIHRPAWLDTLHVDVWQPAMMLVSFGLFLVWSLWLPSPSRRARRGTARA